MIVRFTSGLPARVLALLAVVGMLQLAAVPGAAWAFTDGYEEIYDEGYEDGGPGTEWRKCRDRAWADYNECLMVDLGDLSQEALCWVLFDIDRGYCNWKLAADLASVIDFLR